MKELFIEKKFSLDAQMNDRVLALWTRKIDESSDGLTDAQKLDMGILKAAMGHQVGIMADDSKGIMSAGRLATACREAVLEGGDVASLFPKIIELYYGAEAAKAKTQADSVAEARARNGGKRLVVRVTGDDGELLLPPPSEAEITKSNEFMASLDKGVATFTTVKVQPQVDDGTKQGALGVPFDVVSSDILDDVDRAEMSVEGKRAKKLLPWNFNSLTDKESDYVGDAEGEMKAVLKQHNPSGGTTLFCPYCKSKAIYPLTYNTFGCFDCDKTCSTTIQLEDTITEDPADMPQNERFQDLLGTVTRSAPVKLIERAR